MASSNLAASKPKARVLVIDDQPSMRKLLSRLLSSRGYEVTLAGETAEKTRELLRRGNFDLVVTDLKMPGLDGMSVLRMVREKDPDFPVILVTAEPTTESAIGAVRLRATAYLTKPIDANRLNEEVQEALALYELSRVRKEAHALLTAHADAPDPALAERFERALAGVFMVYQPIVSWSNRCTFGYEALVRSAEASMPHPGALFGAAEKLNRSRDLGRVIRRKTVEPELSQGCRFFINLHADDLLDEELFDPRSRLAPLAGRSVLEITERAQLESVKDAERRIGELRKLGFRIAIDDIGAGYSGLNSFALLKPDMVKLDMALIRDIDKDPVKQRLSGVVIQLCRDLGISVIGEGVETAAERDTLLGLGCDLFQGFLFGRPGAPFPEPCFRV